MKPFCKCIVGLVLYLLSTWSFAADLMQAFEDGLHFDPSFAQARAVYQQQREAMAQSGAALLPQMNLLIDITSEVQSITGTPTIRFKREAYQASATQTLFNFTQFAQLHQASATVNQAAATLSAAEQDLMIRTAQAYFNVLFAKDVLDYTYQQLQVNKRVVHAIRQRFNKGHATITALDQAKAGLDLVKARYIGEQINLYNRVQELREITGEQYQRVSVLNYKFPLVTPMPNALHTWLVRSGAQNLELMAARYGVLVAQRGLRAEKGNLLPTLNATASWSRNLPPTAGSIITGVGGSFENKSVGLSLNFPFFQGGLTLSRIRAARGGYHEAQAIFEQTYLAVITQASRAYVGINEGIGQIRASRHAVKSNKSALKHTIEGYLAGTESVLNILDSQNRLFVAQRENAQNSYAYLLNLLLLRQAEGTLSPENLAAINHWLENPVTLPIPKKGQL